jgi:hypothetical protein
MPLRPLHAALALAVGLAPALGVPAPAPAAVLGEDPVRLALVVPVTVPPSTEGFIPAEDLEQYTSAQGILSRQLDSVDGHEVTLGIDPRIIASIRVLGSDAPDASTRWLSRLQALPNDTFALGYADSDLTAMTQATGAVTAPEGFDFAIDPTRFTEPAEEEPEPEPTSTGTTAPSSADVDAPTPTPTETVPPEVPPLPEGDALAEWDFTLDGLAWPRENTLVSGDLAPLSDFGYDAVLLSSQNAGSPDAPVVSLDGSTALVSDDAVSGALRTAASAVTEATWTDSYSALEAALTAAAAAQPGDAALVATLDRGRLPASTRTASTFDRLDADDRIELVGLSEIRTLDPEPGAVVDAPQDRARLDEVARVIRTEQSVADFATIAQTPIDVIAEHRLQTIAVLSNGWPAESAEAWPDAVQSHVTRTDELVRSVSLVETSNVNLLSDAESSMAVAVANLLDQPVTVYVSVRPRTGILAVSEGRVEVTLEAGSQANALVPVQAVSNGIVDADISLTSANGMPVGPPAVVEVNVQAGWETPIMAALSVLVVGVFGFGVVRKIVSRRRQHDE